MRRLAVALGLASLTAAAGEAHFAPRYVGTLAHEALKGRLQLAKLEWIGNPNGTHLNAVLTLHFGDFSNPEYIAYHFVDVPLDRTHGKVVLLDVGQDVSVELKLNPIGHLVGRLTSAVQGKVGEVDLEPGETVHPRGDKFIGPVEGEYRGTCDGQEVALHLYTFKSAGDTSRVGNPFGFFQIVGQWGEKRDEASLSPGAFLVRGQIERGSYNFFTGDLDLAGTPSSLGCRVEGESIRCEDRCVVTRVAKGGAFVLTYPASRETWLTSELPLAQKSAQKITPPPAAKGAAARRLAEPTTMPLTGEYRGYIHHEYLDIYQRATLTLDLHESTHAGAPTKTVLSAVASVRFGEHDDGEVIPYRFTPVEVGPQGMHSFVLGDLDNDVDPIAYVSSAENGVLEGVWYSQLYGRVGAFRFFRGTQYPHLPEGQHVMGRVSGFYASPMWDLALHTNIDRTPRNSDNPFFPLDFEGNFRTRGISAKMPILGGSYDFYTGNFAVITTEGRVAVGDRLPSGELHLKLLSKGFGTLMGEFAPAVFTRTANDRAPLSVKSRALKSKKKN